jgi:hypothetical protein
VTATVLHDHRMAGHGRIQIGASQRARRLGGPGMQQRQYLLDRGLVAGDVFQLLNAAQPGVRMRIVETRQDPAARKIDEPCISSRESQHLPVLIRSAHRYRTVLSIYPVVAK